VLPVVAVPAGAPNKEGDPVDVDPKRLPVGAVVVDPNKLLPAGFAPNKLEPPAAGAEVPPKLNPPVEVPAAGVEPKSDVDPSG
jgi:hypothetical protein